MPWKKMLAYVTGEIEGSLFARVEYLIEENRVLRNLIEKRLKLTDPERRTLAEKAVAMGKLMPVATACDRATTPCHSRRRVARRPDLTVS